MMLQLENLKIKKYEQFFKGGKNFGKCPKTNEILLVEITKSRNSRKTIGLLPEWFYRSSSVRLSNDSYYCNASIVFFVL